MTGVTPGQRAEVSQMLAQSAEICDGLVGDLREAIEKDGEVEAVLSLMASLVIAGPSAAVCACVALAMRLARTEIPA